MANINNLHTYGPAPVQTDSEGIVDGVLSCIVLQSDYNTRPYWSENSSEYVCRIKGPTRYLQDCGHVIGMELDAALNSFGLQVIQRMPHPSPGVNRRWVVTSINVDQVIAGEHSIVDIRCESQAEAVTLSAQVIQNEDETQWGVTWQSYTMRPQAFCSNQDSERVSLAEGENIPPEFNQLPTRYAHAEYINLFLNGVDKGVISASNGGQSIYWYRDNDGNGWYLNQPEILVAKKAMKETYALYHYPIFTCVEKYHAEWPNGIDISDRDKLDFPEIYDVGEGIDYIAHVEGGDQPIANKPREDCPITLAPPYDGPNAPPMGSWYFVKIDDSVQEDVKFDRNGNLISQTWTRTEKWQGMLDPDPNYYGSEMLDEERSNLSSARWYPGTL